VFIDVDVTLDNPLDVLARLQVHFDDPLEGASHHGSEEPRPSRRDRFEERFSPLDVGDRSALVIPNSMSLRTSACLLIRRNCFGDGFDETLRYGEDVDLVWRLHDRGWLVRYVADSP